MSNTTIFHIGTLYAKPEHIDNLIKSLEGLKHAPGYITHECYKDLKNTNKLTLVEEWQSKSDHENFINSFSKEQMEQWLSMLSQKGEDSYFEKL